MQKWAGWNRTGPAPSLALLYRPDQKAVAIIVQRLAKKCRLFLASGAVKGGALALAQLADGRAAVATGQPDAAVDIILLLEIARGAVAVDKIAQAAAAGRQRLFQRRLDCGRERLIAR